MTLTNHQQYLFDSGVNARKLAGDMPYKLALRYLYSTGAMDDILGSLPEDNDRIFFKAGFIGRTPELRIGYRYGKIPVSGFSTNWASGEREEGISCTSLDVDIPTVYDGIYGIQGTPKIKIQGWYMGQSGADGEPLLHNAKEVI